MRQRHNPDPAFCGLNLLQNSTYWLRVARDSCWVAVAASVAEAKRYGSQLKAATSNYLQTNFFNRPAPFNPYEAMAQDIEASSHEIERLSPSGSEIKLR
jgi:hypothetical protein